MKSSQKSWVFEKMTNTLPKSNRNSPKISLSPQNKPDHQIYLIDFPINFSAANPSECGSSLKHIVLKWWFDGDLPWYNPQKHHLKQIQE